MTEKEAGMKWCPMIRVANGDNVNIEMMKDGSRLPVFRPPCIASKCMMWTVTSKAGGGLREDSGVCGLTRSRN